jgi:glycosyltransferase involved in cell wall biosynthesis
VIWRSVGQSVEGNERTAQPFRAAGMERVAYSPKEANIPGYSGHDALIRFYADPDEWNGWTGEDPTVIQVTQHLRQRDPYTNWGFWEQATRGLNRMPLGPGSEAIGGPGSLTYDEMKGWLCRARVYLYTGTQPASYTLGLIEAMMTGIPVVSIGPSYMRVFPYGPQMFEGQEIVHAGYDRPDAARYHLVSLLDDHALAAVHGEVMRQRAINLFGKDKIAAEWAAFLS